MLNIDLTLPHSYEVEEFHHLPGAGSPETIYLPPPQTRSEHDGLWIRVLPQRRRPWVGVFAFGYESPQAYSGVLSSPDPDRLCVVSKGSACIVKAEDPQTYEVLKTFPVLDVRLVGEQHTLIFSDFTSLAAYGSGGLLWKSPRVCWDDLKIVTITNDVIEGTGSDPTNSKNPQSRFAVDIRTGRSLLAPPSTPEGEPVW
jgi:hypothetical protein